MLATFISAIFAGLACSSLCETYEGQEPEGADVRQCPLQESADSVLAHKQKGDEREADTSLGEN